MARAPRNLYGGIYHLAAHGSDSRYLFVTDRDREDFLERLAAVCQQFDLALLSYVLLGNHYHALVRIPDPRLSRALQRLHTEYSRWHKRRQLARALSRPNPDCSRGSHRSGLSRLAWRPAALKENRAAYR
jgi:REP element-mobilizing transposase RayT